MRRLPIIFFGLVAFLSILAAGRYMATAEFMPYHAIVSGKSWAMLETGLQTIILGMLRIVAGGFLASGVAILWLLMPLSQGKTWANWACLSVGLSVWVPTLYVTILLKSTAPTAEPPIAAAAVTLVLLIIGFALSLFTKPVSQANEG